MTEIGIAIQISIIGISLIFGLLFLTWGLAALLVKLTSKPPKTSDARSEFNEKILKHAAAAAAVAAALAGSREEEVHEFPLPPTAVVSPWQTVTRSKILNKESIRRRK